MMKICFLHILLFISFCSSTALGQVKSTCKIVSPDKNTWCEIGLAANEKLVYRAGLGSKEIISWSVLGFECNNKVVGENTMIKSSTNKSENEKFAWRLGENDTIINHYNQATLQCISAEIAFSLDVRLYDGSVAFRYSVSLDDTVAGKITKEKTQFNFTDPYIIYQYN